MEHWSHMLELFNLTHLALFSTGLIYVWKQLKFSHLYT